MPSCTIVIITYNDKDGLEDGTSFVPSPVRVTEEGAKQRENIDGACPFADIICRVSIVLPHNPSQKQYQVDSYPKKCQSSQPLIHWRKIKESK